VEMVTLLDSGYISKVETAGSANRSGVGCKVEGDLSRCSNTWNVLNERFTN
jgi:hypothetical protein